MPHYTTEQLQKLFRKGLKYLVVKPDGSFGEAHADFDSAAKAGGLSTYDVGVINAHGAVIVYDRHDRGLYDYGNRDRDDIPQTPVE